MGGKPKRGLLTRDFNRFGVVENTHTPFWNIGILVICGFGTVGFVLVPKDATEATLPRENTRHFDVFYRMSSQPGAAGPRNSVCCRFD